MPLLAAQPVTILPDQREVLEQLVRTHSTPQQLLIPLPYQSDLTIYGKDVMDFTVLGLRSM